MNAIIAFLFSMPVFVCVLNAVLNRLPGAKPHSTPFTAGKFANLLLIPGYLVLHLKFLGFDALSLVAGILFVLIYLNCLVFLNWFIFTLTDVSMHIQLMMQLARAGSVSGNELTERYNRNTILGNRVPRLLELGQLELIDGRLVVSGGSVLFGAGICELLRRILGIPVRPQDADHSK